MALTPWNWKHDLEKPCHANCHETLLLVLSFDACLIPSQLFLKVWQSAVGAALATVRTTFNAFLGDTATAQSRETKHVVNVSYGPREYGDYSKQEKANQAPHRRIKDRWVK